ncbi:hypothetical protein V6U90_11240 [Micromonospora sp. CPCC 206060]
MTAPTSIMAPADVYDPTAAMELAATASRTEGRAVVLHGYDAHNWH